MVRTYRMKLESLFLTTGYLDRQSVAEAGIHTQYLTRMVSEGALERFAPGKYRNPGSEITEHHGLVLASLAGPHSVVCLLSALGFHGIGTQLPAEVWVAIERGRTEPKLHDLMLRVVRYTGKSFTHGIETHKVEGQSVRVYSVAKTLADLFKSISSISRSVTATQPSVQSTARCARPIHPRPFFIPCTMMRPPGSTPLTLAAATSFMPG